MITSLQQKVVPVTVPVAINDNSAFTTLEIDSLGFRFLSVYVMFGVTDIAVAVLKLLEGDVSGSANVLVPGTDFSVAPATLPGALDDGKVFAIHVDLKGRKRFFDLSFTAGDGTSGTFACAWAVLSRGESEPSSATSRGLTQELFG